MIETIKEQIQQAEQAIKFYSEQIHATAAKLQQLELEAKERIQDLVEAAQSYQESKHKDERRLQESLETKLKLEGLLEYNERGVILFSEESINTVSKGTSTLSCNTPDK